MWGTFWIPVRKLDELGQGSLLFTASGFALPFLIAIPILIKNARRIMSAGWSLWLLGLSFGIAGSFYAEGALRGNVARVILLFYLTPVWSTLLARIFLNQPISARRMLTLALGLAGMVVILGAENLVPIPRNISEWLGLIAGFSWGVAMVCAQRLHNVTAFESSAVIFFFFSLSFIVLSLIPGGREWTLNTELLLPFGIVWILALAFIWNLPSTILTMYGAVKVEPGKVAILLMLEVIIGIATSALLTDEPFGAREMIGAVLIICAGVTEFVPIKFGRRR